MPQDYINKQIELYMEKIKLYNPIMITLLGGIGIAFSIIIKGNIPSGILVLGVTTMLGGNISSRMFQSIDAIIKSNQIIHLSIGDKKKIETLKKIEPLFPSMSKMHDVSSILTTLGISCCILFALLQGGLI